MLMNAFIAAGIMGVIKYVYGYDPRVYLDKERSNTSKNLEGEFAWLTSCFIDFGSNEVESVARAIGDHRYSTEQRHRWKLEGEWDGEPMQEITGTSLRQVMRGGDH